MQKKCIQLLILLVIGNALKAQVFEDSLRLPPDSLEKIKSFSKDSPKETKPVSSGVPAEKKPLLYVRGGVSLLFPTNIQRRPVILPAFTLAVGLRLIQNNSFIMSLNIPVSLGATTKYDYFIGGDFPFMLDFNLGSAAATNRNSSPGFIFGIGYAYINAANNYNGEEGEYNRADFWGYRVQLGMVIGKEADGDNRIILLLNYGRNLFDRRLWICGLSFQIMLSKP